jgi:branched-chain amino acid transport system ATP-binding protein
MPENLTYTILETKDLTRRFGGLTAIDGVNFILGKGEIRALIGPNGAGKTTLFNLITGVLKPTSGKVFFKERDITTLPPYQRIKLGIGRSFQLINIFPELSVMANVEIAVQAYFKKATSPLEIVDRKAIRSRTEEILEKFEWSGKLNVNAGTLTHAEQKRLETILAIASEPELLLLDEPAAGLDEDEISHIITLIKDTSENRTVFLTDHDIKFIMKIATKITVLHQGRIIAEGLPSEISENKEVQEAYFGGIIT